MSSHLSPPAPSPVRDAAPAPIASVDGAESGVTGNKRVCSESGGEPEYGDVGFEQYAASREQEEVAKARERNDWNDIYGADDHVDFVDGDQDDLGEEV